LPREFRQPFVMIPYRRRPRPANYREIFSKSTSDDTITAPEATATEAATPEATATEAEPATPEATATEAAAPETTATEPATPEATATEASHS
jgi:hypothetical protein